MKPPTAIIARTERPRPPQLTAAARNERAYEGIAAQEAPSAPRYGDTPARPARQQVFQSLSIAPIRAVMRDLWVFGKDEFNPYVSQPYGKSLSWNERGNVQKPESEAYGSTFTLVPIPNPEEERLRALITMPGAAS